MKRALLTGLLLLPLGLGSCLLVGCRTPEQGERDPLMYLRGFRALGAEEIWASVIISDGHVAGQGYNLMGTHLAIIAKFRPSAVPLEELERLEPINPRDEPPDASDSAADAR